MFSYIFQGKNHQWPVQDEEADAKIFAVPKEDDVSSRRQIAFSLCPPTQEINKWPVTQIMRLLRFYAAHRCLWDVECEDNCNRKMRQVALIDITSAMGVEFTKDEIVQKINVLRATYRYEKKRIKQRMRNGQGAKTKLKWFALADAFLRGVPKKGHSKEDPRNSDSDLEDVVVTTTNPESLVPLKSVSIGKQSNITTDYFIKPKSETLSDETISATECGIESEDDDSMVLAALIKPKLEVLECEMEMQLNAISEASKGNKRINLNPAQSPNTFKQESMSESSNDIKVEPIYTTCKLPWTLDTSFEFIQQLKQHSLVEVETQKDSKLKALCSIAKNMGRSPQSIAKRWDILKQTYEEEKQKMLENNCYKPPYKWWSEADSLMETACEVQLESIYLDENKNSPSSPCENEDAYEQRFENPIPSVAPMSNMNEAMSALFHDNFSFSSQVLETENSSHSSKTVWNTLEDDLLEGKWSLKHSVKFLRLYGVHRCLWDLNDPDYRSRSLRNAAIEDIAACMGHGLTSAYVAKKIKIFRITYMQQRKRILSAIKRGETPNIMLKWFPLADSFLRPHIGLRSIKSDDKEMPQFDLQYVYANLNLIDPELLTDFRGKGTQNAIAIGNVRNGDDEY